MRTTYADVSFSRIPALLVPPLLVALLVGAPATCDAQSDSNFYQWSVLEERSAGALVGTLTLRRGYTYYILPDEHSSSFTLDSSSGELRTARRFDRDSERDVYDLSVWSTPAEFLIDVQVTILDANDNSPRFEPPLRHVVFSEADPPGRRVVLNTATDRDAGANSVTDVYRIISGNERGEFELVTLGHAHLYLVNRRRLDRELRGTYELRISSKDGGTPPRFGFLNVNVTIGDANDNAPLFERRDYEVSVNESVPVGTTLARLRAVDRDVGENARVTYSLSDDVLGQFSVDALSGDVTVAKRPLDCRIACVAAVTATDSGTPTPLSDRAYLHVRLLDENDHAPEIRVSYTNAYSTQNGGVEGGLVDEGAQDSTPVASVSVVDRDVGENGKTTTKIAAGNELGHFRLVASGGMNIVQVFGGRMNRRRTPVYNLTVRADDSGSPPRSSTAFVVVFVNDVNDRAPTFARQLHEVVLLETAELRSVVAHVEATDGDVGANAMLSYAIVAGNERGWFDVDTLTGVVRTRARLDYELATDVSLLVTATDGGTNRKSASCRVNVRLVDVNDEAPVFAEDVPTTLRVSEDVAVGHVVGTVVASDRDSGVNGTLRYRLVGVDGSSAPPFVVHEGDGRVVVAGSLDRESVASYEVTVVAYDVGPQPRSAETRLVVHVDDVDDNVAEFYPRRYVLTLDVRQPKHVPLLRVRAHDRDAGRNAAIRYALESTTRRTIVPFAIDATSGVLTLTRALPAELRSYSLRALAFGADGRRSNDSAEIVVSVASTYFGGAVRCQRNAYVFSVDENVATPRRVGRVAAVTTYGNVSRGVRGDTTFRIVDGDPTGMFTVGESDGVLTARRPVDRERVPRFVLELRVDVAGAVGASAACRVTVNVNDVNDDAPAFARPELSASVRADAPAGTVVFTCFARDRDSGENGYVTYELLDDNGGGAFSVGRNACDVVTLKKRPPPENVSLRIRATDSGSPSLSSVLVLHVTVASVNAFAPRFASPRLQFVVAEDVPTNRRLNTLVATDDDGDGLTFSGGDDDATFVVLPDGGLYVLRPLDRETRDSYVFSVYVTDDGTPRRRSRASVDVHVRDVNDNVAVFRNSTYVFNVAENAPVGQSVGTVEAYDVDSVVGDPDDYVVTDPMAPVHVDRRTGVVTTASSLDRENLTEGAVVLRVSKGHAVTVVHLLVDDVNDNAPVFERRVYVAGVSEDAPAGATVATVHATDADRDDNALVRYELVDHERHPFDVDHSTGAVTLRDAVDRETRSTYTLTVRAVDGGVPVPLTSLAELVVNVLDVNDNDPVFVDDNDRDVDDGDTATSHFSVPEDSSVGFHVGTLRATDDDVRENSTLTFTLTGDTFNVDRSSGAVYLRGPLDYEAERLYELRAVVRDEGRPPRSSQRRVVVHVVDVNDNAPTFTTKTFAMRARENDEDVGSTVGRVVAGDLDSGENARVTYSIPEDGGPLRVAGASGVVTLARAVDRERLSSDVIAVAVVARDSGTPSLSSSATILLTVLDEDDNAPSLDSIPYAALPVGSYDTYVTRIMATDADVGASVTYGLLDDTDAETREHFRVESSSGKVYLRRRLPKPEVHLLRVVATSGGRTTTGTLEVFPVATSNNGPEFDRTTFAGSVREDAAVGTSVLQLRTRSGGRVRYRLTRIVAHERALGEFFRVGETSGVVSVARRLDRERMHDVGNVGSVGNVGNVGSVGSVTVTVFATAVGAVNVRTTSLQVTVAIEDVNDNPPAWRRSSYRVALPETFPVDAKVLDLAATDADGRTPLRYRLRHDSAAHFRIDPASGELSLSRALDYEKTSRHVLTVEADDGRNVATAYVEVSVQDEDDSAPTFDRDFYVMNVQENAPSATTVGRVHAGDSDTPQSDVTYAVTSMWGREKLAVDSTSGVVSLIGSLDFEQQPHYVLTVQASDGVRQAHVTVYVNVIDINDNAPVFASTSFVGEVSENATTGSAVTQVSASDGDSGTYAARAYVGGGGDTRRGVYVERGAK